MFGSNRHLRSLIMMITLTAALEAQTIQVTFRVKAPPGTDRITITGDQEILGNWNPNTVPLVAKDSLFSLTLRFPAPKPSNINSHRGAGIRKPWILI